MPNATINGQSTKPIPAAAAKAVARGVPLHKAISMAPVSKSTVKVG